MTIDYRALCKELVDELEDWIAYGDEADIADAHLLVDRARTALAQPEPVGPTDDQAEDLADALNFMDGYAEHEDGFYVCASNLGPFARAVLARWGRPAIEPVPVSERPWERNGWCDENGWCWGFDADDSDPYWIFDDPASCPCWTHLLPHYALPVPEA